MNNSQLAPQRLKIEDAGGVHVPGLAREVSHGHRAPCDRPQGL